VQSVQVVAVPSADWPAIASKHYTFAVFRAVETGAAFVKSEYSHDSAVVDSDGTIVARAVSDDDTPAAVVGDVHLRAAGVPFAARAGDWVAWLSVVAVAVRAIRRVVVRAGKRERERGDGSIR